MAGKPFPKVSDEQRKAFGLALKRDGFDLLKTLGGAAVEHLGMHPESTITQVITAVERDTGAVTVIARGLATIMRERAKADTATSADASSTKSKSEPVDAEFVEDDSKKR